VSARRSVIVVFAACLAVGSSAAADDGKLDKEGVN
jgi:hypothetical protein